MPSLLLLHLTWKVLLADLDKLWSSMVWECARVARLKFGAAAMAAVVAVTVTARLALIAEWWAVFILLSFWSTVFLQA